MKVRLGIALVAAAGLLALTGCGRLLGGGGGSNADSQTDLSWDAQALESIGYSPQDLVPVADVSELAPTPGPSAKAGKDPARRLARHRLLRFGWGKNLLHGEAVVQTDEGTKTVVVQRGTVTAIDAKSVTVKSSDGFTLTWTFGSPITVLERRTQVQPSAIAVGTQVGVAGAKSGDTQSARLIVVPGPKPAS
jgi:hypothetical protein